MRGRKPTPTAILKAQGSRRAAGRTGEPTPPVTAPMPPKELNEQAMVEWRRIVPLLEEMNLLAQADRAALALYCQAFARWQDAEKNIAEDGVIVKAPSGYPVQNPYISISNGAIGQILKLLGEFGLSPSARTRLRPAAIAARKTEPRAAVPVLRIAE